MDISVSRLNHRLALQLPRELPLGLVFVLGRVRNLTQTRGGVGGGQPLIVFDLVEKEYTIRCQLSERAAAETVLEEGGLIRAGGHLSFDPMQADYFLLARDVELVLEAEPEPPTAVSDPPSRLTSTGLGKVLTDVKKRSQAVKDVPSDMPVWVQRMAPPGHQSDLPAADEETDIGPTTAVSAASTLPSLDPKLVDFATQAIESDEDFELTPELLDQLVSTTPKPKGPKPATIKPATPRHQKSARSGQRDWLSMGLTTLLIVLLLITIATFLLLWLR